MFSACIVSPDSKETKLGISAQEASPSAGKNTRVLLVPCSRMELGSFLPAIFGGVDISEVPGCHLLRQISSSTKITSRIGVS